MSFVLFTHSQAEWGVQRAIIKMEIRDNRAKEWFWLDNQYLNGYAKHLGPTCTLVYISLCRHADNKTQTAFPSMELIAEELGMQRASISRAIQKLAEWRIIEIKESYDKKNKRRKNNVYTLTKKTEWQEKPCNNELHGSDESHVTLKSEPCNSDDESHVTLSYSNKTNTNKTQLTTVEAGASRDIEVLIDSFKVVNPSYKKWFGIPTQRKASERLITAHGLEQVMKVIAILPKTNIKQFLPTITTPCQLEDKWAQLEAGLGRLKEEKTITKNKVAF